MELVRLSGSEGEELRWCTLLGPENHLKTKEFSQGQ